MLQSLSRKFPAMNNDVLYATISVFLVVFSGIVSGLTLGLMSLDVMDLKALLFYCHLATVNYLGS